MTMQQVFLCPYIEIWITEKYRKSERITDNDEVRIFLPVVHLQGFVVRC